MVSVRLMTFNHEKYIAQAMDGIMMQKTDFPVEVVVGDDFSQDNTLGLIREYKGTDNITIRILHRQTGDEYWKKRQTLGRLYNFANIIENCQGKYIALLDGDDYWTDPYKLQKQVDFLESAPEYVACYHPVMVVDENNNKLRKAKSSFVHNRDATADELIRGRVMSMLSLCFRNVIREFPEEFYKSPTGDNFICSLLGNHGNGKYIDHIQPSAYRMHASGVWSLRDERHKKMTLLLSYFWIWQYYARLGQQVHAAGLYQKIILEGFYSDPFQVMKGPRLLGKAELLIIRSIRRFFRLIRRGFSKKDLSDT